MRNAKLRNHLKCLRERTLGTRKSTAANSFPLRFSWLSLTMNENRKPPEMDSGDVLGDDGRKALDACVKVKILRRPELQEYDGNSALELILSCYAGSIPQGLHEWSVFDPLSIFDIRSGHNVSKIKRTYDIKEIYETLINFDEVKYVQKYPKEGPGSDEQKRLIDNRRADVEKEHDKAKNNPGGRRQYSLIVAERRVRDCFAGNFAGDRPLLKRKLDNKPYNIDEICQTVFHINEEGQLLKYDPEENLKRLIDENWNVLIKEHQEATIKHEYSWSEAERRVRNCFAGTLLNDTDIFPIRKQSYDIFDIKRAIDNFDTKKLIDKYPKPGPGDKEKKQKVVTQRVLIKTEYDNATTMVEVEHGSGFLIDDKFIITNKHVINTYLEDTEEKYEIHISNAAIGQLPCEVAHHVSDKDLALLYCPHLNLKKGDILPLKLSREELKTGMSIMCFGYPIHYRGETALFVDGKVSGFKETLYGDPLVILNCSLTCGNSGGPVLRRINGTLEVVGVVKQKHTQEILTEDQLTAIVNDSKDDSSEGAQISVKHLSLRLHNALMGTHSPYNFSDALPGPLVAKFKEDCENKMDLSNVKSFNIPLPPGHTPSV